MESLEFLFNYKALLVILACILLTVIFKVIDRIVYKKIGGAESKLHFTTKPMKRIGIVIVSLSGLYLLLAFAALFLLDSNEAAFNFFSQSLLFAAIELNFNMSFNMIIFGKKGFVIAYTVYLKEDIMELDWDRDIGQQYWGVKITRRHKKSPTGKKIDKIYVPRAIKEKVENGLKNYF